MTMVTDSAALIRRLAARDRFVASLGIEVSEAGTGRTHLACLIKEEHVERV